MLVYIQFSYFIIIPLLLIFIAISLYFGDKIISEDIAFYIIMMITSPIILSGILVLLIFILAYYILFPLIWGLKKLKWHIPKISNVELASKKQIRAELILANYKVTNYRNKITLYEKDGFTIKLNNLSTNIIYKSETESISLFSSSKINAKLAIMRANFIQEDS